MNEYTKNEWIYKLMNSWVNEWMNEWNEWMNEWYEWLINE